MKEFVLIFRTPNNPESKPSPEQIQARMAWLENIEKQGKLADKGKALSPADAKTIKPDNIVTDGPYTAAKEFVSGYMIVKTDTIDEAVELAKANPVFKMGGNIELREVMVLYNKNQDTSK